MTNIDFNERIYTFEHDVQDILSAYFESTDNTIRAAAMEISIIYANRENELLKAILESTKKSFGL